MDIQSRNDIELLVTRFYDKVTRDEIVGFIFNDVMKVNWEKHLPVMYNFWETVLLDAAKYSGNTMGVHFEVNRRIKLEEKHFTRWLQLFTSTVDELFSGKIAELAKKRAGSIASLMQFKMDQENQGLSISPK
jgi:hemoglobin